MKKIFMNERFVWAAVILAVLTLFLVSVRRNDNLTRDYETAVSNNMAFVAQMDSICSESRVFKVTIDQLEYFNDSVVDKLREAQEQLSIKDEQIRQLNYIATELGRTDTVVFTDTIFRDAEFSIDTCIGDEWVSTHMVLKYPNVVSLTPTAVSRKHVLLYSEKVITNKPSKLFFVRWFQRKHTVLKAVVKEENPHIKSESNMFIEIVE